MAKTVIDVVAKRPEYVIRLPNDSEHDVVPYRGEGQALLLKYRDPETPDADKADMLKRLVHLALPSATPEDWASASYLDWTHIIAAANGRAELVEEIRGNAENADGNEAPAV